MKATVKLDTRRKNKDGLFPVVIRISHKQGHADIPTELYALESEMYGHENEVSKGLRG